MVKGISSFSTNRRQGNARAKGALPRLLRRRGWPAAVATAEQVHGSRVVVVPRLRRPGRFSGTDGLLTDVPGQPLAIFTADCLPVFLASRDGRVGGVLHAGWRGLKMRILARAVRLLRRRWNIPPAAIRFWAGPAIGPCCYDVGWDVARHFPRARRHVRGRWRVDLRRALRFQGTALGLRWDRRLGRGRCTCHEKVYHSFRRDRTDARQASILMVRPAYESN